MSKLSTEDKKVYFSIGLSLFILFVSMFIYNCYKSGVSEAAIMILGVLSIFIGATALVVFSFWAAEKIFKDEEE